MPRPAPTSPHPAAATSPEHEFASYADFIYRTADESEEIRAWRERIAEAREAAKS